MKAYSEDLRRKIVDAIVRGMVGRVVGRYGGEEYVAVDVRFPDGRYRLFWPEDLEEISFWRPWWRSLLRSGSPE